MFDVNQVVLVGRVGAAPELRTTKNGKAVVNFSLATKRPIRTPEGWDNVTEWHRVVAWEKKAEWVANRLQKGDPAVVSGNIRYSSWTDEAGVKRYMTKIHADTVSFMARQQQAAELPAGTYVSEPSAAPPPPETRDGEPPF